MVAALGTPIGLEPENELKVRLVKQKKFNFKQKPSEIAARGRLVTSGRNMFQHKESYPNTFFFLFPDFISSLNLQTSIVMQNIAGIIS